MNTSSCSRIQSRPIMQLLEELKAAITSSSDTNDNVITSDSINSELKAFFMKWLQSESHSRVSNLILDNAFSNSFVFQSVSIC